MRELSNEEVEQVAGGYISGYQAAGAILTVTAFGAAIATAPLSAAVVTIAVSSAGGMAVAQAWADFFPPRESFSGGRTLWSEGFPLGSLK